jgi:dual specificity protein kinase YAK1
MFEKLDMSLLDLLKIANFQGFTLNVIAKFGEQILNGLKILKRKKIVHCDLKPENILLMKLIFDTNLTLTPPSKTTHRLKIIDLGSACSEKHFPFQYIQSRYYRSPEVMLGLSLTPAIDMWSVGCVLMELYLGIPIFPGSSGYDQLLKIFEILG